MQKCFELAVQGETFAFPNPNVACLIYYKEELISYGVHRYQGKAHAEVIAITNLKENFPNYQNYINECDLILNLEPCSHYGNTPPCTSLIKETGFKKVAFAAYDPNPAVYKRSLEILSELEIIKPEDLSDEIQEKAQLINRAFFAIKEKEQQKELPVWLSVKVASYPDGSMITKHEQQWITANTSRQDVHRYRSTSQLLITSSATVSADNPSYNVRHNASNLNLLDIKDPDIVELYQNTSTKLKSLDSNRRIFYKKISSIDKASLKQVLRELSFQGYQKIMVEAGPTLSSAFIESGLVDELIIYQPKENRSSAEFVKDCKEQFTNTMKLAQVEDFNEDYKAIFLSTPK